MAEMNVLSPEGKFSSVEFGVSTQGKPFYTFTVYPAKVTPSDVILFTKKLEKLKKRMDKEVT